MDEKAFQDRMARFQDSYHMACALRKIPQLKSVEVPLDGRLMKIGPSDDIKEPYVISITNPFEKGQRFCVPLGTSMHSSHKISISEMAKTVKARITDGQLKVTWAYGRSVTQPKTDSSIGVDTGIVDALSCSDGNTFGSMKEVLAFYCDEVEPAFAEQSKLRSKENAMYSIFARGKLQQRLMQELNWRGMTMPK